MREIWDREGEERRKGKKERGGGGEREREGRGREGGAEKLYTAQSLSQIEHGFRAVSYEHPSQFSLFESLSRHSACS